MSDNVLSDRGNALENAFFKAEEVKRIEKLKENADKNKKIEVLKNASGIKNPQLLERLVDMNLNSDTIAAVSLVPLIHVAWADGTIDDKERSAILKSASEKGVDEKSAGYQMLESWLNKEPGNLFSIWNDYVSELITGWSASKKEELGNDVLKRAKEVAEAAGGLLGLRSVSQEESQALGEIQAVFEFKK